MTSKLRRSIVIMGVGAVVSGVAGLCLFPHPRANGEEGAEAVVPAKSAVTVCAFADCQALTWNAPPPAHGFLRKARDLFARCAACSPDVILVAGDLASDGRREVEYDLLFQELSEADLYHREKPNLRFFPVAGDHDISDNAESDADRRARIAGWKKRWDLPGEKVYYSYDRGNVHFVGLSVTGAESEEFSHFPGGAQYRWLVADLEAARKNPKTDWVVAYWHRVPREVEVGGSSTARLSHLMEVMEKCGVDLVINGHQHCYQRTYPVVLSQEKNEEGTRKPALDFEGGVVYLMPSWDDKPTRTGVPFAYQVLALGVDNATSRPDYKGVSLLRLIFTGKRLSGEAVNAVDGSVFDRFAIDKSSAKKVWSGF